MPTNLGELAPDIIRERAALRAARVSVQLDHLLRAVNGHEASRRVLANLLGECAKFVAAGVTPKIQVTQCVAQPIAGR
jgi:hypothetical protein